MDMTPADMAAVSGRNGGEGALWLLVLFIFMFGMGGFGGFGRDNTQPVQADIQRGFDQNTVQNMLGGLNGQIGQGFAAAQLQSANQQMAQQQMYMQGQMAQQQGISDLRFTISQENCQDRQALNGGLNNLMAQNTAIANQLQQSMAQGFQGVQDKLCALQIENLKEQNAQLTRQLQLATLSASQVAQTAQLVQNNNQQTANLMNRLAPIPIPAYTVANPYTGVTGTTKVAG